MADEFDYKDYTQVHPESNTGYKYGFGRDKTPYVKGRPYERGQDFYPDRLFRDEQSAVRQFWDSPNQDPEFMEYIESFPSGKKGNWKREQEKDAWIKTLRDVDLRNRGTEGRYHPGPITTADELFGVDYRHPGESWGLVGLLKDTRAEQMKKYSPYYGMTEKQLKDYFKKMQPLNDDFYLDRILRSLGGARWPYGYGVDPSDKKGMARIREGQGNMETFDPDYGRDKNYHGLYYKTGDAPPYTWDHVGERLLDFGKETTRSGIAGIGWLADALAKGAGQTFYPFDIKDQPGTGYNLPRGWSDLSEYTDLVNQFRNFKYNAKESLPTEYAWNNMGYSEKKDLNDEFKKYTGSEWDLDLDYHPLMDDSAFKEWTHDIASKDIFTPSGGYDAADQPHKTIWNPFALMGWGPDSWDLNTMDAATLLGDALGGWGAGFAGKKAIQKTGQKTGITKLIPELIKKHPKLASLLGIGVSPFGIGAVEQAVEDKKWPEWPEWPSNDPKGVLESLSKE